MRSAITRLLQHPYSMRHVLSRKFRARREGWTREHYRHIVRTAAGEAVRLNLKAMSVLEFGVAGGNGLVEFERVCAAVSRELGIEIQIWGFDTGKGLPPPVDYRDVPYLWQEGFFEMDVEKLKARLRVAKVVFGDVKETVPQFTTRTDIAPIGAIAFDLDYYSSTVDAFRIFDGPPSSRLPRVYCYFDDLGVIQDIGVNLAISEFNRGNDTRKISISTGVANHRDTRDWGWRIYEMHDFKHPTYATPLVEQDQLPLR